MKYSSPTCPFTWHRSTHCRKYVANATPPGAPGWMYPVPSGTARAPEKPGYVIGEQPATGSALFGSPGTDALSTVNVVAGEGAPKRLSPVQYWYPGSDWLFVSKTGAYRFAQLGWLTRVLPCG